MLKELNWKKVSVTTIISLLVLFGGWFLYQNFQVKQPIEEVLLSVQGVHVEEIKIERNQVNLYISFSQIDNLQETYNEIEKKLQSYVEGKKLMIHIKNNGNQELEDQWNQYYFYIAEAIDQKQYSLIPKTIEELKTESNLNKVGYSMDQRNIYIDLHHKNASFYVVIPKGSDEAEVNING